MEGWSRRIIEAIRQPFQVGGGELSHTASVGISFAEPHDTPSSLIENADMAMYQAKLAGRNALSLFDPKMQADMRARMRTWTKFKTATGK